MQATHKLHWDPELVATSILPALDGECSLILSQSQTFTNVYNFHGVSLLTDHQNLQRKCKWLTVGLFSVFIFKISCKVRSLEFLRTSRMFLPFLSSHKQLWNPLFDPTWESPAMSLHVDYLRYCGQTVYENIPG